MTEASTNRDDLLAHLAQKAFDEYQAEPTLLRFPASVELIGARDAGNVLAGWWKECPPSSDAPMTDLLTWLARLKPWTKYSVLQADPHSAAYAIGKATAEAEMKIMHIAFERRRIARHLYGMFWAAYVFEEVLRNTFDEKGDPALVVSPCLAHSDCSSISTLCREAA